MIRAAVVTVSDSCHQGSRQDLTGPALCARLQQAGFLIAAAAVVPDERERIAALLVSLADERGVEVIFTAGGTGLAARDVTPEATRSVIDREIPGLAELMRAEGIRKTPLAALSRGVAGTRGGTLIVNLPGSPKGACESLDAIVTIVPHIVDLLAGRTAHREQEKLETPQ